ncbi:MAG: hypothetical protein NT004_11800 [Bacteroidetes bacterium]|nr:hypothetical protein [Bacteroidota bacterium]
MPGNISSVANVTDKTREIYDYLVLVSLIPVFLFLIMLLYLDSLKLLSKTLLFIRLAWGFVSAGFSFFF